MILDDLRSLSTAEEFFTRLEVPYDPQVLNVARLHILRRMGQYLSEETFGGHDEATAGILCRAHLEQAYADFVVSSPLEQRVFKVLRDAVKAPAKAFVPLTALSGAGCET